MRPAGCHSRPGFHQHLLEPVRHHTHQEDSVTVTVPPAPPCASSPSPLDELDGPEGLIHISDGQEKAEVEHGIPRGLVAVLQPHEVPQGPPAYCLGDALGSGVQLVLQISFSWLDDKWHCLSVGPHEASESPGPLPGGPSAQTPHSPTLLAKASHVCMPSKGPEHGAPASDCRRRRRQHARTCG